jgi:arylsulfatase A
VPADEPAPDSDGGEEPQRVRPNVVVVVIDDMGWEDLATTPVPTMDALMARGRVYTNFYVCPACSPSRAALQFGRYSVRDGLGGVITARSDVDVGMPLERTSLPEVFGPAGYATACFGKWHISTTNETELRRAAQMHGYETWRAGYASIILAGVENGHLAWIRGDDGEQRHTDEYTASAITNAFLEWWGTDDERPRFAVVNYLTPHQPFTPPPEELLPPGCDMGDEPRARYERAISALDTLLGRLVAGIDLSNTYLFVLPDNGTPNQVAPPGGRHRGYKLTPFQGGVNVPLVVVGPPPDAGLGPGVLAGRCDHLAHVVDVPRTLFELCGLSATEGFEDSRNFAPTLRGTVLAKREPVYVHHRAPNTRGPFEKDLYAVISASGWKLIVSNGEELLFDVSIDPYEAYPRDEPEIAAHLRSVARGIRGE